MERAAPMNGRGTPESRRKPRRGKWILLALLAALAGLMYASIIFKTMKYGF
jgi:hypothetical protein